MTRSEPTGVVRRVVVAGVSARAAAESAARAGFDVTSVDAFGDLDHHPSVRCLSLPRDFGAPPSAHAAASAARTIECDAVAYVSNLDNHPRAVAALAAGRTLWGNPPAVLRRVRDPRLVVQALRSRGLAAPRVLVAADVRSALDASGAFAGAPETSNVAPGDPGNPAGGTKLVHTLSRRNAIEPTPIVAADPEPGPGPWLVKPLASGGGHGVRRWQHDVRVSQRCYLQEFVEGMPGSVVFVAGGGRAVPIGLSCQLVGERAFGVAGYRYCGNILASAHDAQFGRDATFLDAASRLAGAVSEAFDLVGVNGIDFIAHRGVPWAIEVNPRWSASMELVERAYGLSVFGAHAAACVGGALPDFDLARARHGRGAWGKAVVFARSDVVLGDTHAWLADASVRDVPHPGEIIRAGRPICTVFAEAADAPACHAALIRRADRVYADLAAWGRAGAQRL